MCGLFSDLGAGAEIGSIGELELARKAGFARQRIVFAGPGKSEDELRAAIQSGILSVNVESMTEIEDIAEILDIGIDMRLIQGHPRQMSYFFNIGLI